MSYRIILSSNYSPWSPYSGGGQRSTHHLAEALSSLGYDVHLIFSKTRNERIKTPSSLPYTLHWAEYSGIKSNRKNWFRAQSGKAVAKIVNQLLKPRTVYHSNGEESSEIASLRANKNFPFILTPRYPHIPENVKELNKETRLSPFQSKFSLLGKSLQECDIYCPTSKFAVQLYRDRYSINDKPFEVIPNGIPDEFINLDISSNSPKTRRIIFFGRLSQEKGVDTLLKAASTIANQFDELHFIGRGELETAIENANKNGPLAGKVIRTEWLSVSDLIKRITSSTLAVLPSFEESFGNAIVEAMACGIPVITTNAGSIPEIITQNKNGIMIEPGNSHQLSSDIENLLNNPEKRRSLGKSARETVVSKYSWESTAKRYLSIYSDLLDGQIV
ncbi:MAG: glycosyltransferase family 4 protein [bacterium]|nr:glycosyltransferase family 4 protein [bacterium]